MECGPGDDSPAELFKEPCGTPRAGSALLNFCIAEEADLSASLLKVKEDLALANMSFALETLLLLRALVAADSGVFVSLGILEFEE